MLLRLQALALCPPRLSGRLSVEASTERAPEQPQTVDADRAGRKRKAESGAPQVTARLVRPSF